MAHLKPALVALVFLVPGMAAAADCSDWNTPSFFDTATADEARECLDAGADPEARDEGGQTLFDLIPEDSPLKGTKVYWLLNWLLNEARFR